MSKICTSLEQSKKLIELGINVNTADMWYAERYEGRVTENGQYIIAEEPYYYPSLIKPSDINYSQDTIKDIPAWSLTALLDILPKEEYKDLYLCFGGYCGNEYFPEWFCSFVQQDPFIIKECHTDNLIDAAFEMVVWLKEKGVI